MVAFQAECSQVPQVGLYVIFFVSLYFEFRKITKTATLWFLYLSFYSFPANLGDPVSTMWRPVTVSFRYKVKTFSNSGDMAQNVLFKVMILFINEEKLSKPA